MEPHERLATLMATFEQGGDVNMGPFDMSALLMGGEGADLQIMSAVEAFAHAAADDTPQIGDTPRDNRIALVIAGLLQGLALGYAYAWEEENL